MADRLISAHGGQLVQGLLDERQVEEIKKEMIEWPSWTLSERQLCDLELLLSGAFSPLKGFMGRADYESVCESMRLSDGTLWPLPICLDLDEGLAGLAAGSHLVLRDPEGVALSLLDVEETWRPDLEREARLVFGGHAEHPGVVYLRRRTGPVYAGGRIRGLEMPRHPDFAELRLGPAALRARLERSGWKRIVAFQTRNPMHRAHVELTLRAAEQLDAGLLLHPVVGQTKPGDVDHFSRVRCYRAALAHYPKGLAMLSLLPLAMRMGGPREALLHAIVRRNHGCSHLIVGRDHAGPGSDSAGQPFYGPYEAQELMRAHRDELGIEMVPFKMMVYVKGRRRYFPVDELPPGEASETLSGTQFRQMLERGAEIPDWFSYPEVVAELRRSYPPRERQGLCVFFTGLPSSGKSTLANLLAVRLLEVGGRQVSLLDGDIVRTHLSSELGFSREHRDINIRRIGFVASEIVKNGGVAICAPIAPYERVRAEVREMVSAQGGFFLVHVSTPLGVCEQRDRKGLYAKARQGIVEAFTGISDPYEEPRDAELSIDTSGCTADEGVGRVLERLAAEGYIEMTQKEPG
ncbi:MAG: bifunctional sulfate adenylyltransferase/adenylylsulfate kinase [Deltaproteobacteria bacterium]|nr:bifunctional sulfate adenylyltransferase/adenylylsulfate kinase [Deltaproteobacteria bacterium]